MTESTEIDVDALQSELDQIKDAMGLRERYPSQFGAWPVWGVLVLGASLVSQYVHLADLPGYLHAVGWFGMVGLGWGYQWLRGDGASAVGDAKPNVGLQFGSVFLVYVVFAVVLGPALGGLSSDQASVVLFSLVIALVGAAYLVAGNSLRAYYIRRLDRYAFYVGGAWMLVLAALIPNVAVLQRWGYATYGVLFAVHSLASYLVLARAD